MELKIQSLNVRLWTKENNPFKPHFWLWRTFKQAIMFLVESPDVICLQEVQRPVGGFLLGLWRYKGFSTNSRIPIFVKKKTLRKKFVVFDTDIHGGTDKTNGHGSNILHCRAISPQSYIFNIQNCHLSWATEEIKKEMRCGFVYNTIFCGDMNVRKDSFINNLKKYSYLEDGEFIVYPKTPTGPTYVNYDNPNNKEDIDQFGFVGKTAPEATVTVLPNKLSDHFPVIAKFEI